MAEPHQGCQCKAFEAQGWPCRNKIDAEDLLCATCRSGPCMQLLLFGDPPEPLWGHQPYVKVRFDWRGPS